MEEVSWQDYFMQTTLQRPLCWAGGGGWNKAAQITVTTDVKRKMFQL